MGQLGRIRITLTGSANWRVWYRLIKSRAGQYDIWNYVDPDGEAITPQKPPKPTIKEVNEKATKLSQLNDVEKSLYLGLLNDYRDEVKRWEKLKGDLQGFYTVVESSLSTAVLTSLASHGSARELLKTLKTRYAPSEAERRIELSREYRKAFETPSSGNRQPKQLLKWAEKIQDVVEQCTEEKPGMLAGNRSAFEFVLATEPLKERFYDDYWHRLVDGEEFEFHALIRYFINGLNIE